MFMTASTRGQAAAATSGISPSLSPSPALEEESSGLWLEAEKKKVKDIISNQFGHQIVMLFELTNLIVTDCENIKKDRRTLCVFIRIFRDKHAFTIVPSQYVVMCISIRINNSPITLEYKHMYIIYLHHAFSRKFTNRQCHILIGIDSVGKGVSLCIPDRLIADWHQSLCKRNGFPEDSLWASLSTEYSFTMSITFLPGITNGAQF